MSQREPSNLLCGLVVLMVLAALPAQSWGADRAGKTPPNIVLILADDLGYECIGVNGSTSYKTPALDALAATGARFDRCYAQPLCTPTRVQLMTGIYNVRNYTGFGSIEPRATTFAHLLKKAGYATCITGKWQLGTNPAQPQTLGFDESCLWHHTRRVSRYANAGYDVNGKPLDNARGEYGPDIETKFALDFITRNAKKPFLVYWPMVLTHSPFEPTPDSAGREPKAQRQSGQQHFSDMVAYMDKQIGQLVAHLEKLGLRENTLILFVGDNGTGKGILSRMGDKVVSGAKGSPALAGMHVPLIVNWPAAIAPGRVYAELVDTTDFLPTLCQAAGAAVPAELRIDGQSFLPQVRGEKGNPRLWSYCWYAPRGAVQGEFAYDRRHVLHRDGTFERVAGDGITTARLAEKDVDVEAAESRKLLQAALDRYKEARPAAAGGGEGKPRKGKEKQP